MIRLFAPAACVLLLLLSAQASSQTGNLQLPVIIDADRTDYDGKTSMMKFTNLRLSQGGIGIEAETARATRMDFDDSVWQFSGNVVFDVNEGHVTCDSADLTFANFQLLRASIQGSPATFEFKRPGNDQTTYAEAGKLNYDVVRGVIEFSGGATISEGGNQITSDTLFYNIKEQRINAASSGSGEDRVKVTYAPDDAEIRVEGASPDGDRAADDADAIDIAEEDGG